MTRARETHTHTRAQTLEVDGPPDLVLFFLLQMLTFQREKSQKVSPANVRAQI